jgi:hypothetical protein
MTSRPSPAAPILAALAVVLVTLGEYAGGYFWLGDFHEFPEFDGAVLRQYDYDWQVTLFWPASQIEERLRRAEVVIGTRVKGGVI